MKAQAILGRNRLSPEFPSIESPPIGIAIWSQCSKMVICCHTVPIAVPVLKNSTFGLMTNLANSVSQAGPCKPLFKYFNELEERRGNYPGFVPGSILDRLRLLRPFETRRDRLGRPGQPELDPGFSPGDEFVRLRLLWTRKMSIPISSHAPSRGRRKWAKACAAKPAGTLGTRGDEMCESGSEAGAA